MSKLLGSRGTEPGHLCFRNFLGFLPPCLLSTGPVPAEGIVLTVGSWNLTNLCLLRDSKWVRYNSWVSLRLASVRRGSTPAHKQSQHRVLNTQIEVCMRCLCLIFSLPVKPWGDYENIPVPWAYCRAIKWDFLGGSGAQRSVICNMYPSCSKHSWGWSIN